MSENTEKQLNLESEIKLLREQVSKQNDKLATKQVILRGFTNGLFSALGATVGFALLIFIIAKILSSISFIPYIDTILQSTKLDTLIEYQLEQIENPDPTPTPEE